VSAELALACGTPMRHSTQLGAPLALQALLGHSSSEMTRDVYLHSIPADARAAGQKVEDLVMGLKLSNLQTWKLANLMMALR
jgi:hypothetical protein